MAFLERAFRGFISKTDPTLLILSLVSSLLGLVFVYSATHSFGTNREFIVQAIAIALGFIAMIVLARIDYELLGELYIYLFIINALFLLSVFVFGEGKASTGNQNWIRFGPVGIQPSEFVKISFIIILAKQLAMYEGDVNRPKHIMFLGASLLVPLGIIVMQGDMGSALVFLAIFLGMCFSGGVSIFYFLGGLGLAAAAFPIIWTEFLKDYQKMRILTAFNPELDPIKYGYQVIQSKSAISSGHIWGNGLLNGYITQNELLPAKHTDSIFAVIGEEGGLVACTVVILLLTALIVRCVMIGFSSNDRMGKLIAIGVASMLLFQAAENIGMCLGLLPVIGITLPFFSYGGSSILTVFLGVGLLMSVKNRPKNLLFT